MKTVFADTGYWAALLNPNDQLHERAGQVSAALGKFRILTTEMVLDELLAALSKVPLRPFAIRGVEAIRSNPNVEVVPQTSLQFGSAFDSYRSANDKELLEADDGDVADDVPFELPVRTPPVGRCRGERGKFSAV